ncbi:hypothetical protein TMLG_04167, partial [Mycobacterium tuberculosis SUMu012]
SAASPPRCWRILWRGRCSPPSPRGSRSPTTPWPTTSNPLRFAAPCPGQHGWRAPAAAAPPLDQVRRAITEHLLGAARRRAFRVWLDARRNALVVLAPGYEHPGDPRQPDNTRRH